MSINEALFVVHRSGTVYKVKGQDLAAKFKSGDKLVVQRPGVGLRSVSKLNYVKQSDLLVAEYNGIHYKVTGLDFLNLLPPKVVNWYYHQYPLAETDPLDDGKASYLSYSSLDDKVLVSPNRIISGPAFAPTEYHSSEKLVLLFPKDDPSIDIVELNLISAFIFPQNTIRLQVTPPNGYRNHTTDLLIGIFFGSRAEFDEKISNIELPEGVTVP